MRNRSVARVETKNVAIKALIVLVVGLAIYWVWPSNSIELSRDGYAIATALYRVCNQQDHQGLKDIDEHLQRVINSRTLPDDQHHAIRAIIRDAQSGDWDVAMKQCRSLLENQVSRLAASNSSDRR